MTPDQIFGCVAIAAMLALVVARLSNDPTPQNLKIRMAVIWVTIIAMITFIALIVPNNGSID